jgi:hypothetical protein
MASIWKQSGSRYWTACFRDQFGRQRRVSTKETDRKKAKRIADEFEKAVRTRRTLRQTQTVLARLHEEIAGEPGQEFKPLFGGGKIFGQGLPRR